MSSSRHLLAKNKTFLSLTRNEQKKIKVEGKKFSVRSLRFAWKIITIYSLTGIIISTSFSARVFFLPDKCALFAASALLVCRKEKAWTRTQERKLICLWNDKSSVKHHMGPNERWGKKVVKYCAPSAAIEPEIDSRSRKREKLDLKSNKQQRWFAWCCHLWWLHTTTWTFASERTNELTKTIFSRIIFSSLPPFSSARERNW